MVIEYTLNKRGVGLADNNFTTKEALIKELEYRGLPLSLADIDETKCNNGQSPFDEIHYQNWYVCAYVYSDEDYAELQEWKRKRYLKALGVEVE